MSSAPFTDGVGGTKPGARERFSKVVCLNIDQLGDAARRSNGDQQCVDQYLDMFWMFSERGAGRSGLEPRVRP